MKEEPPSYPQTKEGPEAEELFMKALKTSACHAKECGAKPI